MKWVEKLFYRIPIFVLRDDVKYDSFVISSDKDLQVLFHCRLQFFEVRTPELLVKLVDVLSSFGDSNQNPQSSAHPACSSSMPVGASLVVPVIIPEAVLVASPSFAANLNRSGDAGVGATGQLGEVAIAMPSTPVMVPIFGEDGVPDGIEDALHDDDDDVESATVADDSDDDIPHTTPVDKEEIMLSVKTYSIRRGVEYKVLESDHRKYYGKWKEFGNDCTWLIRVSLRQHRADAAVSIKITMSGSVTVLRMNPVQFGGQVDESSAYFHRLFCTFLPYIKALCHCKPLVDDHEFTPHKK
ncbi:uncharacterized protein LOC107466382 [Arachis duranensis]|uniref:Uncharacterized protein LOC107466382 n=1 Tax=Arachis duranensis TaxID=130453 RepID=A0A6P4BP52_ARADU|nr:uncharacterized protein LOC107466382 [Arachis duranensis]